MEQCQRGIVREETVFMPAYCGLPFRSLFLNTDKSITMKILFISAALLLSSVIVFSQSQVGQIDFQKQTRPAIVCYCPYKADVTEGGIKKRMSQLGNKPKEKSFLNNIAGDGFIAFKGASLPDLQRDMLNVYFKVEKKGIKDHDDCVIYMVLATATDQFISYSENARLVENAKKFLDNMIPHVDAYGLDLQIAGQEDAIAKSSARLGGLTQDSIDLAKKRETIEFKLRQNAIDRQLQNGELDRQRRLLEAMKSKRKKMVLAESVARNS